VFGSVRCLGVAKVDGEAVLDEKVSDGVAGVFDPFGGGVLCAILLALRHVSASSRVKMYMRVWKDTCEYQ